ncbi:MAG: phosphohistidine phosphatase SixA [Gemmatimonadales bacterium]
MRLLVIRHAIAMDREKFARDEEPDDQRPLTAGGAKKMKRVVKGLRAEVRALDHLATSPLTRAVQTADIVADAYGIDEPEVTPALTPDARFEDFEAWCATHEDKDVVAVVGHEPHLSSLVTWLLTSHSQSRIELGKGGACLVDFESAPCRDSGTLSWLLTPKQLRRLAR